MTNVLLFGAGASFGAGDILPERPPLGRQLFGELARCFPSSWGGLSRRYRVALSPRFRRWHGGAVAAPLPRCTGPDAANGALLCSVSAPIRGVDAVLLFGPRDQAKWGDKPSAAFNSQLRLSPGARRLATG